MVRRAVVRTGVSPMNPKVKYAELECGHDIYRTRKPHVGALMPCDECHLDRLPIILLVRRVINDQAVWLEHSRWPSLASAARHWERHIKGMGITAWSWWGPKRIGEKMLADPSYNPDRDAIPVGEAAGR
jgi:hypothetical protein